MKIYLDNCCYNRPFDDQSDIIIKLESEAISFIQREPFDYTKWQENLMENMSVREISDKAAEYRLSNSKFSPMV
ncbi:MAG: hypothetical protein LBC85_04565 [Fibromonadaceae bacterium]|jgi:hypothetical protein|nr:hypothetical protein [Fibromonadaceae bacterium]